MPEQNADTLDLSALPFWQWDTMPAVPAALPKANLGFTLDTLLPVREAEPEVQRSSIFRHHALQPEHTTVAERPTVGEPAWVFVSLVLLSGLLCLYYKVRKINLLEAMKSTIDSRALDRLVRDCNLNRGVVMVSMGLLMVAAVALPAVRLLMPGAPWYVFLAIAAGLGLLYIIRNGLMRWLGNVFERKPEVSLYITSNYVYHLLEATVLTAGLYFHFYLPAGGDVVALGLGAVLAAAFVMRLSRGAKIILSHPNASCFYLFYYLCTVELIPALVALRVFIMQ